MEAISSFADFNPVGSLVDNMTCKISEGRKSETVAGLMEVSSDEVSSDDPSLVEDMEEDYDAEEESNDEEESDEEEDFEEEEEDRERTRILEDMFKLKKLVGFFQHPEMSVEVDGFSAGRSFFSRLDAPEMVSEDEDEELAQSLADAQTLKKVAADYLHPERSLEVDATACSRNYFSQPWAAEQETFGQAEARARLVVESMQLKDLAAAYSHPEAPVNMEPGTTMGRNYFKRASAHEQTDEEQALILKEMRALKQLAVVYKHPEKPVHVDASACGRNYFVRSSATEQEEDEHCDDREIILAEMEEIRQAASDYMHPEKRVEMDFTCARNYFDRASAPQHEEDEYADEREIILAEMEELKQAASDFMHPEKPVKMDPTCPRNYFERASAAEQEEDEYADEREIILAELEELRQAASDYMHPEKQVEMDSTCARNYFDRASAAEEVDFTERELFLKEMQALKELAVNYMHPEKPIKVDATASGCNYFSRPSATEQEQDECSDDREIILAEMEELGKATSEYMHPEKPVEMDSTCARSYFDRASAPLQEEDEYSDDREIILAEMEELRQAAADYMHPEKPVVMDSACPRNYFERASACEEDDAECDLILQEMQSLKKLAVNYMHPENPLEMDPAASGRNYFTRASAPEQEDLDEECDVILQEMQTLKRAAVDFLHPEKLVEVDASTSAHNFFSRPSAAEQEDDGEETEMILKEAALMKRNAVDFMHPECPLAVDPAVFGRNYFGRASAVDKESFAEAAARIHILADAAQLKKSAVNFLHPEIPVDASPTVFGRNFFSRASADDLESDEEEHVRVLADAAELKRLAVDYLHPEKPVDVDSCAFGRNFFGRASADDQEDYGLDDDRQIVLEDFVELKQAAVDYMHPEMPVSTDATAFGRNYFGRASAASEESLDETDERASVLAETAALKRLAIDYAHPELPLVADAFACARSYFSRASAPVQDMDEETQERARVLAEAFALKKLAVDYHHPEASVKTTDSAARGRNYFARGTAVGVTEHISTSGYANATENDSDAEEHSHHDDYGHFEMDEEMFYDMRQSIVLPGDSRAGGPKIQSSKMSSEEEGELSRSPSSVMLFTGALEDAGHPPLPPMG